MFYSQCFMFKIGTIAFVYLKQTQYKKRRDIDYNIDTVTRRSSPDRENHDYQAIRFV